LIRASGPRPLAPPDVPVAVVETTINNEVARPPQIRAPQPDSRSVRVDAHIVLLVARDAQGRPVADLKADDVRILEDGIEQRIDVFTPMVNRAGRSPLTPAAQPANTTGRVFMVLIDDMNVEAIDRPGLTRTLEAIKNMVRDDDLVGIVSTGYSSIEVDLSYDRGHTRFNQAIAKVASTGLSGNAPGVASLGADGLRYMAHTALRTAFDVVSKNAQLRAAQPNDRRKAFIYVSSGYSVNESGPMHLSHGSLATVAAPRSWQFAAGSGTTDPFSKTGSQFTNDDLVRDISALTRAAKSAGWPFYTVNPKAIRTGPDGMTADQWSAYVDASSSLQWISSGTGGFPIGQADLAQGLERIDQETDPKDLFYYLVGYNSSNQDVTQKTRTVEVRATRPGLQLSYPREYTIK
jgi:VWFA-related protein